MPESISEVKTLNIDWKVKSMTIDFDTQTVTFLFTSGLPFSSGFEKKTATVLLSEVKDYLTFNRKSLVQYLNTKGSMPGTFKQ